MPTEVQVKAAALQERIFTEKYYTYLWCESLHHLQLLASAIDKHELSDKELVQLCQHFWEALPDKPQIRRGPFFALCDITERIFDADEREAS